MEQNSEIRIQKISEVIDALRSVMSILFDLGYSMTDYNAGPEYGAIFESSQRNRKIEFFFSMRGDPNVCIISRSRPSFFSRLWSPSDRRLRFTLQREYFDNELIAKIPQEVLMRKDLDKFKFYSEFFRTTLFEIISGERWITEK